MAYGWKRELSSKELSDFQDWHARTHLDRYFTNVNGRGVISTLARYVRLKSAEVVDYGAGPGFLTRELLNHGSNVVAVDISQESLAELKKKCPSVQTVFALETKSSILSDSADAVVLAETIEHLTDEILDEVLSDIRRILRPSGALFITTPNEEDLAAAEVCCPYCGGAFHPVLHVRRFTSDGLKRVLEMHGFSVSHVKACSFGHYWLPDFLVRIAAFMARKKLPHLYAVAKPN